MTKRLSDRLPPEVLSAFDGRDLEGKIGPAYVLMTVDPDGAPRPCMLSAGEILAVDERHLRFALWPKTNTSRNLAAGSSTLLCFVAPGTVLYVRGRPRALGPSETTHLERFELRVDEVESDEHAGMPVTGTIGFSIGAADQATVVAAWRKQLVDLGEA